MKIRDLQESDIPRLCSFAEKSGFEYPELNDPNIEKILVVADDEDEPILAVAAQRLVQIFGWMNPTVGAELRNEAIRAIEGPMAEALRQVGYDSAEVFIPPKLERRGLGRILRDRFGWYANVVSYGKRLI